MDTNNTIDTTKSRRALLGVKIILMHKNILYLNKSKTLNNEEKRLICEVIYI